MESAWVVRPGFKRAGAAPAMIGSSGVEGGAGIGERMKA